MKIKAMMSAICAVIMSVSVLAGCGDSDSSSSKDTKKDTSSATVVSESESVSEETSDEDVDDEDEDDEDDEDTDDTDESGEEDADEIKYYNSDYWGETGLLYEIPEDLWGNDLTDISTAASKMFSDTVKSVRAVDVFHTYSGSKTGAEGVPDVWYVSAGYPNEGYKEVEDNEGAYEVAYPVIEETAKYAYARMYDLDYAAMPEDEILRIEIIEEDSGEKTFADIPPYAADRTASYSWLGKDIKVVVFARERQVTFYLNGGFVKADTVKNAKNVPMFVFAFSKDETNKEYLSKIINHAFETLRHT